jgi:hypothetical protein
MAKATVSFRLDPETKEILKRSAKAAGMQLGCFVEQIVLEKLDGSELERMSDDLDAMRREIEELREELAVATEATLVVIGSRKPYPPETAKSWVTEHLRRRTNGGH